MRSTSALQPMFLPGLALLLSLTSITLAQENPELGRMWTFEKPPLAYLEKEHGFEPDQSWLDSLRLGSLRLSGARDVPPRSPWGAKHHPADGYTGFGSASFVSPQGLILTSNRCVRDAVAATLDAAGHARDGDPLKMIRTGFVAATPEDELRLRARHYGWLTAAQLIEISNVTDEVNEGIAPTDNEIQSKEKREANKQTIFDAAKEADPELVPKIVSLYQGAVFQLYQYKVYDDVRLVCIPHLQTAHFGGDSDNFTYPRYSLDFAFLRAYEDGKPANTMKHYFKWKSGGAKKSELVFVSGNPGTTNRLFTKAQLELERDIRLPMKIEFLTNRLRLLTDRPGYDPENPGRWWAGERTTILGLEIGLKTARGKLKGLEDAQWMAQKTAAEKAFQGRVMGDEKLAEQYGDLWDRIAGVVEERRRLEARERFHSTGGLALLDAAVLTVRSCDPAEAEEHRKQAKTALSETYNFRPGQAISDHAAGRIFFEDHAARSRGWLTEDDPYFSKVLGGRSGSEFLSDIYAVGDGKILSLAAYTEQRSALIQSGWKAIQDCEDLAIVAARELVILMRQNEKRGEELDAKEEALGREIAQALLACYGTEVGPDGTETLRVSDGVVRGFCSDDSNAPRRPYRTTPYRTTFYGLYARNAEFDDEFPFNLPKIWLDRKDEIDMTKPVNFVSTNDIAGAHEFLESPIGGQVWQNAGGSSGSVVVNKDLEVVGVVVDGNIESLGNDFVFTDDVPRSVSVHVDGIMEALVKIYDAHRIAEELTGKQPTSAQHSVPAIGRVVTEIDPRIWRIHQTRSGDYWFGSNGNGVYRYDGKRVIHYGRSDGLGGDQVRDVEEDKDGNVFISTNDAVTKFDGTRFETLELLEAPADGSAWVLDPDDVWLVFDPGRYGPCRYDGERLYHLRLSRSPAEDERSRTPGRRFTPTGVYSIYRDRRGHLWFGTAGVGVCRYDGEGLSWLYEERLTTTPSGGAFGIRCVYEDRSGYHWICNTRQRFEMSTDVGVRDGLRLVRYATKAGLPDAQSDTASNFGYFSSMTEDHLGAMWMACGDTGVWRFHDDTVTKYPVGGGAWTTEIHCDRDGRLWVGTLQHGVFTFAEDGFEPFVPATSSTSPRSNRKR